MKLLTHNMLACHIKGVKNNFPFLIEAAKVEVQDADYNPDFLRHVFPRIQWAAFLQGAESVSVKCCWAFCRQRLGHLTQAACPAPTTCAARMP
jgi:hypothetical protein